MKYKDFYRILLCLIKVKLMQKKANNMKLWLKKLNNI